jgi:FkbM family methyltransferase
MLELFEQRGDLWWPKNEVGCYRWTANEIDLPEYLMKHVPERQVMVQAGGNMGWFTRIYAQQFERMYVFEPDPVNFTCLNLNVPDRHVIKIQSCLGNTREFQSITSQEHDRGKNHVMGGNDLIKRTKKGGKLDYIPTLLIDDLNLDRCDFIHLDIEGYEYFALQGAEQTIKTHGPVIAVERAGHEARYGLTWDHIQDYLANLGYGIIDSYRYEVIFSR